MEERHENMKMDFIESIIGLIPLNERASFIQSVIGGVLEIQNKHLQELNDDLNELVTTNKNLNELLLRNKAL